MPLTSTHTKIRQLHKLNTKQSNVQYLLLIQISWLIAQICTNNMALVEWFGFGLLWDFDWGVTISYLGLLGSIFTPWTKQFKQKIHKYFWFDLDKSLNCPPAAIAKGSSFNFVKNIILDLQPWRRGCWSCFCKGFNKIILLSGFQEIFELLATFSDVL